MYIAYYMIVYTIISIHAGGNWDTEITNLPKVTRPVAVHFPVPCRSPAHLGVGI